MSYPLFVAGFENHDLDVQPSGFVRGPRLLLNGNPAPRGNRRYQYVLTQPGGSKTVVQLKPSMLDPVPKVFVDGEQIEVVEPLSVFQLIWSGLPLVMLLIGGAIGGLIGGGAYWTNVLVFRSEMSTAERYILTALISGIAVVFFLIVSAFLPGILYGLFDTAMLDLTEQLLMQPA